MTREIIKRTVRGVGGTTKGKTEAILTVVTGVSGGTSEQDAFEIYIMLQKTIPVATVDKLKELFNSKKESWLAEKILEESYASTKKILEGDIDE